MMWHTHSAVALNSLWIIWAAQPDTWEQSAAFLVTAAVFGGLFPDLDAPSSKLQQFPVISRNITPFALLSQGISSTSPHRGWLHSLYGLTGTAIVLLPAAFVLGWVVWMAFAMGYISHLIADALTPSGIAWLGGKRRRCLLPKRFAIVTGSAWEELFFVLAALSATIFLLRVLSSGIAL